MPDTTPHPALTFRQVALALETLLEPRRAVFKRPVRINIGTVEGPALCIDTRARQLVSQQWVEDADLSLITTQQTLSDMLLGELDLEAPRPSQMLAWGGDGAIWKTLAKSFAGRSSAFTAHLSSLAR